MMARAAAAPPAAAPVQCSRRRCAPSSGRHGLATSPQANTPGSSVRPQGSVGTPPSAAGAGRFPRSSATGAAPTATSRAPQSSRVPSASRTSRTRPGGGLDTLHRRAQPQVDPVRAVAVGEAPPDRRSQDAQEGHGQGLDHRHRDAQGPRAGGHLGPDEAGADDHQRPAPLEIRAERPGVGQRAQVMDVRRLREPRDAPRPRPGREHEVPPANARPPDAGPPPDGVHLVHPGAEAQLHVPLGPEGGRAQHQGVGVAGPGEELLGQRRPFVGRVRLIAGHEDPPRVASGPQRLRAAPAREARAHHEDVRCVHAQTTVSPSSPITRIAPIGQARAAATAASAVGPVDQDDGDAVVPHREGLGVQVDAGAEAAAGVAIEDDAVGHRSSFRSWWGGSAAAGRRCGGAGCGRG